MTKVSTIFLTLVILIGFLTFLVSFKYNIYNPTTFVDMRVVGLVMIVIGIFGFVIKAHLKNEELSEEEDEFSKT